MAVNENKWGFIYCPKHTFRNKSRWDVIERVLRAHRIDYDYVHSESAGSVDRLVKMMVNNGYRTIIIAGGDSALNDAVNSLMQFDAEVRQRVSLGVIPNGTMNDFAHYWVSVRVRSSRLSTGSVSAACAGLTLVVSTIATGMARLATATSSTASTWDLLPPS